MHEENRGVEYKIPTDPPLPIYSALTRYSSGAKCHESDSSWLHVRETCLNLHLLASAVVVPVADHASLLTGGELLVARAVILLVFDRMRV